MFRHGQPLRHWAARVLLLWLLGLAASMANACLGGAPAAPSTHAHQGVVHDGGAAHHDNAAPDNCQDFCSKASVSIPPQKSTLDDLQQLSLAAVVALVVLPVAVPMPARVRLPHPGALRSPPIPIAFLRLTR